MKEGIARVACMCGNTYGWLSLPRRTSAFLKVRSKVPGASVVSVRIR